MAVAELPFVGQVVWLTVDQGGRQTGPPNADGVHYRPTAFVPPYSIETGLAGFLLQADDVTAWVSGARGGWALPDHVGEPQTVTRGSVVVVTEGRRRVGYFHVEDVLPTRDRLSR